MGASVASLLARIGLGGWVLHLSYTRLLASPFGLHRLLAGDFTANQLASGISILTAIACGILVLLGAKIRWSALLAAASFGFMAFETPPFGAWSVTHGLLALGMLGGLLQLSAHGAGKFSLDRA